MEHKKSKSKKQKRSKIFGSKEKVEISNF